MHASNGCFVCHGGNHSVLCECCGHCGFACTDRCRRAKTESGASNGRAGTWVWRGGQPPGYPVCQREVGRTARGVNQSVVSASCCTREGRDFVCRWPDGRSFKPDYVTHTFRRLLEQNGLPIIRLHDLRHTCGSLLLEAGHDIKRISSYLGHANISTTADIYTYVQHQTKVEMSNDLEQMIR